MSFGKKFMNGGNLALSLLAGAWMGCGTIQYHPEGWGKLVDRTSRVVHGAAEIAFNKQEPFYKDKGGEQSGQRNNSNSQEARDEALKREVYAKHLAHIEEINRRIEAAPNFGKYSPGNYPAGAGVSTTNLEDLGTVRIITCKSTSPGKDGKLVYEGITNVFSGPFMVQAEFEKEIENVSLYIYKTKDGDNLSFPVVEQFHSPKKSKYGIYMPIREEELGPRGYTAKLFQRGRGNNKPILEHRFKVVEE